MPNEGGSPVSGMHVEFTRVEDSLQLNGLQNDDDVQMTAETGRISDF